MTDDVAIRAARGRVRLAAWALMGMGVLTTGVAVFLTLVTFPPAGPWPSTGDLFLIGLLFNWSGWVFAAGWSLRVLRRPLLVVVGCAVAVLVPTHVCCYFFTAIIGAAALWLTTTDAVQAGFAAVARRDAERDEDDA